VKSNWREVLSWAEDPLFLSFNKGKIYSIGSEEDGIDYNTLVRAPSAKEAKNKFRELIGMIPRYVSLFTWEDILEAERELSELEEMDEEGYYIYDSGT
jgi:hypothetical protein